MGDGDVFYGWRDKLSAHLGFMFNELPFLERFEAASLAGFKAVEFPDAAAHPLGDLVERLRDANVVVAQTATSFGDVSAGEKGFASLPGREAQFRHSCEDALKAAQALDCRSIHVMAGAPGDIPHATARETYVSNIAWAAELFAQHNVNLLIEVINSKDAPFYYLDNYELCDSILSELDFGNIGITLDVYHAHVLKGTAEELIRRLSPWIAHVQIADFPGRNEPLSGTVNFPAVLKTLDEIEYRGWIGCEYKPRNGTMQGLDWKNQ